MNDDPNSVADRLDAMIQWAKPTGEAHDDLRSAARLLREHADTADRPLLTITYTTDAPQLRWRTGGTTYYRNLQAAAPDSFAALGVRVNGSTYYAEPDGDDDGVELCIRSGGTTYRFEPSGSV